MSEQTDDSTDNFEAGLRKQLRAGEHDLDTRTRARLAAARREALEQEEHGWSLSIGRPAWGTLAVVVIVATIVNAPWQTEQPVPETSVMPQPPGALTDPLAAGNGDEAAVEEDAQLEMYENLELLEFYEDMEFYEWLADTEFEEMAS